MRPPTFGPPAAFHLCLALGWLAYVAVFPLLSRAMGAPAPSVAYLVVMAAGWWGGARQGVLHGLISLPVIVGAYLLINGLQLDVPMLLIGGTVSTGVAALLGGVVGHLRDLRLRLEYQADHDGLTHLLSRAAFTRALDQAAVRAARQGSAGAVLFIDLDDFKSVNDTYGHAVGDALLLALARRLVERGPRGHWGRMSGDEFTLLVPRLDNQNVSRLMKQVRALFDEPLLLGGDPRELTVKASIGAAVFPRDGRGVTELLRAADHAMYADKRTRRTRTQV